MVTLKHCLCGASSAFIGTDLNNHLLIVPPHWASDSVTRCRFWSDRFWKDDWLSIDEDRISQRWLSQLDKGHISQSILQEKAIGVLHDENDECRSVGAIVSPLKSSADGAGITDMSNILIGAEEGSRSQDFLVAQTDLRHLQRNNPQTCHDADPRAGQKHKDRPSKSLSQVDYNPITSTWWVIGILPSSRGWISCTEEHGNSEGLSIGPFRNDPPSGVFKHPARWPILIHRCFTGRLCSGIPDGAPQICNCNRPSCEFRFPAGPVILWMQKTRSTTVIRPRSRPTTPPRELPSRHEEALSITVAICSIEIIAATQVLKKEFRFGLRSNFFGCKIIKKLDRKDLIFGYEKSPSTTR